MATFDVELTGGAPWGFSMVGGSDFNQPLNISKVISPQISSRNQKNLSKIFTVDNQSHVGTVAI